MDNEKIFDEKKNIVKEKNDSCEKVFEIFNVITDKQVRGKWKIISTDDPNPQIPINEWNIKD